MFVIFIACISIYEGEMEIGVLIALNIIIAKTFSPIISFYDLIKKINASQLDKDFDSLSKIYPKRDGKLTLIKSLGKIELKKISLQYPEHQIAVFEDFSLIFEPGSVTVITGKNGVGKSTLYRIITGIQKPDKGEILIDNINIEQIKQDIFKKQFISVPQEPSFFEGTIKENFSAINEELSNDNIISAISNSNLGEFLGETEKGIDTFIDSKGSKFSLGIKKRLALARASLTNGSIVIFDEPTEGLDQEGANLYYKYLNEAMKLKKTIIILSHDKEIIKGADNIINLNNFSKNSVHYLIFFIKPMNKIRIILLIIIIVISTSIIWAKNTSLDIVAVAPGKVVPSNNVKVLQHLEGGIIEKIKVVEGSIVKKGDVLVKFRQIASKSEVGEIKGRLGFIEAGIITYQSLTSRTKPIYPKYLLENYPEIIQNFYNDYKSKLSLLKSDLNS